MRCCCRLLWVIASSGTGGSIEAVDLSGSNRHSLVTGSSGSFRDLVVDPVT